MRVVTVNFSCREPGAEKKFKEISNVYEVGKACFEMVDYMESEHAFTLARRASPYSLEGMDVYSSVLFHLKEEMKLSYLAQELISTDRLAPQSWCAMGNCYSLQKDREIALKNFQRVVNLKSTFSYAHTFCGHEYGTTLDLFTVSFLCLIVFLWDPQGCCRKVF